MEDDVEEDDKVIAVYVDDPAFAGYNAHDQLPQQVERQRRRFFEGYEALEGKRVVVVDDFLGADEARQSLSAALALYTDRREAPAGGGGRC